MGVGVAGLQAIATARRLGAVTTATDVRPATKEQVASLGAKFIAVENDEFKEAETAGGYAKQMSAEYQALQAELTASHVAKQDIVVTTALIPLFARNLKNPLPLMTAEDKSFAPDWDDEIIQGCALTKDGEIVNARLKG